MTIVMRQKIYDHRIEYPNAHDPEVSKHFLSLEEYQTIAKKIIGKFAPKNIISHMLKSEDAIAFVVEDLIKGDWRFNPDRPKAKGSRYSYRNQCGKWSIHNYLGIYAKQRKKLENHFSIDNCGKSWDNEEKHDFSIPDTDSPSENTIEKENQLSIQAALSKINLTDKEKHCLELYYFKGLNYREIGEATNVTRQAAQISVSKAKKKIEANREHFERFAER